MGLWKHLLLLSFILLLISKCESQEQQQDDDTTSTSRDDDDYDDNNNSEDDEDDDSGDQDSDDDSKCSFISGQGYLNGICKYCAMCIPSNCILATPYSTGNNDGSTCDAIGQDGYDFYNYCLSPGDQYLDDDESNGCPTSTVCYQYRHSSYSHAWDNLTCAQDSCLLLNRDGTPPPVPGSDNINITVSGPNNSHPTRQHYNQLDVKSGSAASIALLTSCIILALCLVALVTRCFCRTRLKRKIALFLNNDTFVSPPPSFHSNSSNTMMMMMMMMARAPSRETLPDYDENLPPKYEHAIVTQIRGFASTSTTEAGWIPVYVSPLPAPPNDTIHRGQRTQHGFQWVPSHQDWATIQHDQ
jgi:hypothetical protein